MYGDDDQSSSWFRLETPGRKTTTTMTTKTTIRRVTWKALGKGNAKTTKNAFNADDEDEDDEDDDDIHV